MPDSGLPVRQPSHHRVLAVAVVLVLVAAAITRVVVFRPEIWPMFATPEATRAWVAGWGVAAPLVFVGAQIVQVVIFVIPGETVQIAGGYLFGFWAGALLTILGIGIGSMANFALARFLGLPFAARFFRRESLEKLNRVAGSSRAQIGFFLLFVIPGIPKDVLCYVAGLSRMRLPFFLAVSLLGRLPGILGSVLIGSSAAEKKWVLSITIFVVACALFAVGFLLRDRIQSRVERLARRP